MRWRRRRTDEDFGEEVRAHLENEADRLIAEGMAPDEARAAAHRHFGNVTRTRERFHDAHRSIWLEQFVQDLRYAWRGLWHSRAFVATTVLTLAVGMGLVTVVFAVFNAYVLRPFAVHDPYSLYAIGWRSQEAGGSTFRWRDYQDFQARQDLFDGAVAEATRNVVVWRAPSLPSASSPATTSRCWARASRSAAPWWATMHAPPAASPSRC